MSTSDSDLTPDDESGPDDCAVQKTPEPKSLSGANRGRQMIPLSPAWIKQSINSQEKKDTMGLNFNDMKGSTDLVLFSIPAGVRLDDLHGKHIMFPKQAGARSTIEGHRLEVVCDPPESSQDLHLLGVVNGATDSKAVSQVYSLQIPLADVPADEEPIDETILASLLEALAKENQHGSEQPPKTRKKKSKKGKKVRDSTVTGDARDVETPQLETEPVAAAPPDTDGHAQAADDQDVDGQKEIMIQNGAVEDAMQDVGDDEYEWKVNVKRKKKKKKKRHAEATVAVEAAAGDALDAAVGQAIAGMDDESYGAEAVARQNGPEEDAAAGGESMPEKPPSKRKKRSKSAGGALESTPAEEARDIQKRKKKRARSLETAEDTSPTKKKKSK